MSKPKEKKLKLHQGHRLVTRRDFLAQGLISGCIYTMAPGILTFLQQNVAYALECGSAQANPSQKTPVIIFDLAGGANFPGSNVIVGGMGGQGDFLADYTSLGLPPDRHPSMAGQLNVELGLMFHNDSGILRGIQSVTSLTARSKVDGAIFCNTSSDDTQNNPHNPMYWLSGAGAKGGLVQLAGTRNTVSGGRSIAPQESINPTLQPVILTSPNDALGLISTGKLGQLFGTAKAERILKAIERMSESKIASFNQQSLPNQIKDLIRCGYISSKDLINKYTPQALDPAQDTAVLQAFDNLNDEDQRKTATIAKLVIDGHIGAGTVEKGNYDYHDRTRATGEVRDFDAGDLIGRVIRLAELKAKNVLIYVITDGGISASATVDNSVNGRGKYIWEGDSGQRSSAFMLLYRHAGRATLRSNNRRQMGYFKANGSVENTSTPAANSVTNLAKLFVANYMALHGDEGNFQSVVGSNPFSANLDNYLVFDKII